MTRIGVEIEALAWTRALPEAETCVRTAAEAALAACADASGGQQAGGLALTVLLADDATVRDLNLRFRGKDQATNVLSFPAAASAHPHIGDIALALETCAAEAGAQSRLLGDHVAHLVAHGVLHLFGYDHHSDDEAEAMEQKERDILHGIGVADPYAARGGDVDL